MNNKKPESENNSPEKQPEKKPVNVPPNPDPLPDKNESEEIDLPLKGFGLPDRDLKKNLGCG